jgi:4-hydroxybenzoate polyprenyltransferase/geranylgeranylglycerol-phosphate geranylgeranyltransferase
MCHSGLVAIAGIELASSGQAPAWRVALAALVTICGWEAGLYAGDYYDRDIDAASKPDRAIPSGRVTPREAFATMVGLIVVGYACALALGFANFALAVFTTALGIAYSKTFKSKAILGNFDRGVLGVCAVLFGALAGGNVLRADVLALAALVFFHDSATNLVGAIRDVDGDRAAGCPTVPVIYGLAAAVDIVVSLVVGSVVAGIVLAALVRPGGLAAVLLLSALVIAVSVYAPMWRARRRVTRSQALAAHKWLVVERLVLMSGWIAVYAPLAVALGLLAGALLLTVGSQALLRDRYERQRIARPSLGGEHVPV